jgi:hypothetical protein
MLPAIRIRPKFHVTSLVLASAALATGLAAGLAPAALAVPPTWSVRFNGGSQDAYAEPAYREGSGARPNIGNRASATDAQGNVYVAGNVSLNGSLSQQDFLVAKYDAAGTLLWYRTTDGGSQLSDTATCLALSPDAVFVTGETCTSSNCDPDFLTVKYDAASGAQRWVKRADGPGPDISGQNWDEAPCVAVDASGNPAVAGTAAAGTPGNIRDFLTIRYDGATGNELWRMTKSTNVVWSSDTVGAIGVGADGHVVVTGTGGDSLLLTVKYNFTNGAEVWSHSANLLPDGIPHAIVLDAGSNPIVVGQSELSSGDPKFFTLKYRGTDGFLFWLQKVNYAPLGDEAAHDIALDGLGNAYVTGPLKLFGMSGHFFHTVKYEAITGVQLWAHSFGLFDNDYVPAAIAHSAATNRVVVAGFHATVEGGDFFIESLDGQTGNAVTQAGANFREYDSALSVAIDAAGNALIGGMSHSPFGPGVQGDLRLVKYDSALSQTWTRTEPVLETHEVLGSLSPPQFGRKKIAIDNLGNLVVVGSTAPTGSASGADFLVQRYGPGGNRLWSRTIDGGNGLADYAVAVTLGGTSDVYVTGWSLGLGTDYDILTLRLNAATGATIWSQRYNNGTNQADVAYGIALGSNRVFVVGAFAAGGKWNPLVLGYPVTDGNSPWAESLVFPGGGVAYAVAVGCREQVFNLCIEGVYLTGVAVDAIYPGSGNEFMTALFDAGSGNLVTGLTQGGGTDATGYAIAATGSPATVVATGRSGGNWMTTAFQGNSTIPPLWTTTKDFDARDDQAFDVAFDLAGNAFVAGFATKPPAGNRQSAIVKYNATTGAELAVGRLGPIDEDLTLYGVATDFAGTVYAAGTRYSLVSRESDFALLQYDNNLALQSGNFFDSAGSDDQGTALTVDRPSGDAVVAGTSFGASAAGDLLIAKYRAPEKGRFFTMTPCRLYDSRSDPAGPLAGGQTRIIFAQGFVGGCSLLSFAVKSLAVNVTVLGATGPGYVQVYPGNIATPNTSLLNFVAGQTRANNGVLSLATNAAGTFVIRSGLDPGQTVHVIVDATGYFD